MLTTTRSTYRNGETHVLCEGKYIGTWLGEKEEIDRLVKLSNADEERRQLRVSAAQQSDLRLEVGSKIIKSDEHRAESLAQEEE